MTDRRTVVAWGQLAAHAAGHGRRVSVADVCAIAVCSAQVSGAWLAAARNGEPDFVMCVTDLVSEQLAELQLTLGEGPCHDVLAAAAPVLAGDLGDEESGRRWPAFTPEARQLGATAVFAFPLMIGAIRAGVIGLYRVSRSPVQRSSGTASSWPTRRPCCCSTACGRSPGRTGSGPGRGRAVARPGGAPGRDRPGHRHAHRAARRQRRGGVRPAPGLRLCPGQAAGRRGR